MRLCQICGARVRNLNPRVTTCDGLCTRAKKNGVSYSDQVILDMEEDERASELRDRDESHFRNRARIQREEAEGRNEIV